MNGARRATHACRPTGDDDLIESVKLDFDSIPAFVKAELAITALDAVMRFLNRPDAQAILNTERELLRREGSTLLDSKPPKSKGESR